MMTHAVSPRVTNVTFSKLHFISSKSSTFSLFPLKKIRFRHRFKGISLAWVWEKNPNVSQLYCEPGCCWRGQCGCCSSKSLIRTGRRFHIERRAKKVNKGFSPNCDFDSRPNTSSTVQSPVAPIRSLELLLPQISLHWLWQKVLPITLQVFLELLSKPFLLASVPDGYMKLISISRRSIWHVRLN